MFCFSFSAMAISYLYNRAGKSFSLLARRASVSVLTHFIWTTVCIKKPSANIYLSAKGVIYAVPPFFSLTSPIRPYPVTGINRGNLHICTFYSCISFSSPVPKLPSMRLPSNGLSAGGPFSLLRELHVLLFVFTFFLSAMFLI